MTDGNGNGTGSGEMFNPMREEIDAGEVNEEDFSRNDDAAWYQFDGIIIKREGKIKWERESGGGGCRSQVDWESWIPCIVSASPFLHETGK